MDPKSSSHCPSCGTRLEQDPASLADGLCPSCLLERSLQSTIAGHPGPSSPPAVEEVAPAFPELEILELIGRGGMGAVYKARQKSLDRLVALKLLPLSLAADPEFTQRFEAEAKALAALNHPNIVTVHEFGQQGDFYFLLMEYVDGPNLRNLLADHRLAPEEALTIIPPLCEALEFAHKRNIVHCDIKPENLLLNTDGQVKIADFGIARILGQSASDAESEKTAGTPAYMAPEQIESPQSIDTRADIYSLGVVFYEMLTGERPNHELTPPSGKNPSLDVRLDEVVMRALDANPNFRWQSANELNSELQTILTEQLGEPKVAPPENLPSSNPKWAWISCGLALGALVIFVSALLANRHIAPVSRPEHQAAIDRYFEYRVHLTDLRNRFDTLEAKPQRTPAEEKEKQELWEQVSEGFTLLDLFGALRGVKEPPLGDSGYHAFLLLSGILAVMGLLLGLRHLSWLRGQEEPLPALGAGVIGTLLCPLLLASGLILTAVVRFNSLWANTLGFACALLLTLWSVRRLLAWTRNHRNAPIFGIMLVGATVLIAVAVAAPCTSARKSYRSAIQRVASETIELEQKHQVYFTTMSRNERLSLAEKLEEAKSGCEEYAQKTQSLQLLRAEPLKLRVPKAGELVTSLVCSLLALAIAFILIRKSRPRRA